MESAIANIGRINSVLASAPLTLIHNDCNPRNICLHKQDGGQGARLCLYDWELAKLDTPQRDLAEFLTFTLSPATSAAARMDLIDYYRRQLEIYSKTAYPLDRYSWQSQCTIV